MGPGTSSSTPPVCPRHPDRVSYVLCQRCGRPACPECQRAAAVGVHCVDCVREAARSVPPQRTVVGGKVRPSPPVVTITLITLCVASYVIQLSSPSWTQVLIFAPVVGKSEPYRFLSAAFLHSTGMITHLLFNMVALWFVGPYLENTLGRWRYLSLYVLSAIGGNVLVLLLASPPNALETGSWYGGVLGASGAIFGTFGAVLIVVRRLGQSARSMFVVIALNLVFSFAVPGISWQGHIGGLIVGTALGAAYAYAPRDRRLPVAVGSTLGVAVLLVVLAVVRYAGVG